MIGYLLEKWEKLAHSGPQLAPQVEAQVSEEIEDFERAPLLMQLAYIEPMCDRLDDLQA